MESGTLFTPPGAAVAIIIGLITLYTAYIWYMGRNTVPAPAYIAGFENKVRYWDQANRAATTVLFTVRIKKKGVARRD